jgi:hypothetical protein
MKTEAQIKERLKKYREMATESERAYDYAQEHEKTWYHGLTMAHLSTVKTLEWVLED